MEILSKPLSTWTIEDIELLIELEMEESIFLDYKRELPVMKDGGKKDFLADITSFANHQGGTIIYGVSEKIDEGKKTNKPDKIEGINSDPSQELNRLEQVIGGGITPRLLGVTYRQLKNSKDQFVVVFKIQKSWTGPHMVSADGTSRFYTRTQSGNMPMDYTQIRSSFLENDILNKNIETFVSSRTTKIRAGEGPLLIKKGNALIIHVVPIGTFSHPRLTIEQLKDDNNVLRPIGEFRGFSSRVNLEGFVRYDDSDYGAGYAQVYRSGIHEFVDETSVYLHPENSGVSLEAIGKAVQTALKITSENLIRLGVFGPKVIFISLGNVKGRALMAGRNYRPFPGREKLFDRQTVQVPNVYIEEDNLLLAMKELMDPICNAAGYDSCVYLKEDGTWDDTV